MEIDRNNLRIPSVSEASQLLINTLKAKVDDVADTRLGLSKESVMPALNGVLGYTCPQLSRHGDAHLLALDRRQQIQLRFQVCAWHVKVSSIPQWSLMNAPGLWPQQRNPVILLGRAEIVEKVVFRINDDVQA